jgi:hypothetical protein
VILVRLINCNVWSTHFHPAPTCLVGSLNEFTGFRIKPVGLIRLAIARKYASVRTSRDQGVLKR